MPIEQELEFVHSGPAVDNMLLTRRDIIVGVVASTLALASPAVVVAARKNSKGLIESSRASSDGQGHDVPFRRYMAAATALAGGRIIVTGGYDQPWSQGAHPRALNSTWILDGNSGQWIAAKPMNIPRARHSAVTLADGRVAVIGGVGMNPTASVEVYDPRTDSWEYEAPLNQPRYDHTTVVNGNDIYVLGGSSQSMSTGMEVLRFGVASQTLPE